MSIGWFSGHTALCCGASPCSWKDGDESVKIFDFARQARSQSSLGFIY